MNARAAALLALISVAAPSPAAAETVQEAYAGALEHYYGGRYKEAVAGFQRVLAIPLEHPDLRYNLGCAHFRLGQHGRAIYNFERALALDPGAEDAAFNLKTVRALVAGKVKDELKGATRQPLWVRTVGLMSAGGWATLFLSLWWLTLGILFLLRFIGPGPARSGLVAGNSFFALLALVCGALLFGRAHFDRHVTTGIVLPESVEVREGPDAGTRTSFRLHAGLKVRVQARDNGWIRIRLPNGLEGWVSRGDVGIL